MAGKYEKSFLCSDTLGDFLWVINDVEEDEDEAAEDISELLKSLDWISFKKFVRATPQSPWKNRSPFVWRRYTALKVEQTIAQ